MAPWSRQKPKPEPPGRGGFTLIELLVVIATVGALLAILLPSLKMARSAAMVAACASNMRQLSAIVAMYESDNNNTLPKLQDRSYGVDRPSFDPSQELDKTWVDYFAQRDYLPAALNQTGLPGTLLCPSVPDYDNDPSWAGHMPQYALNFLLHPPDWLSPLVGRRSFYGRPTTMALSTDKKILLVESRHLTNPRGWFGAGNSDWVDTRHAGGLGANVVYLAGNVEFRTVQQHLALEDVAQPFSWINFVRQPDR